MISRVAAIRLKAEHKTKAPAVSKRQGTQSRMRPAFMPVLEPPPMKEPKPATAGGEDDHRGTPWRRAIPYVFASGYSAGRLRDAYRTIPRIRKPF